MGWVIAFGIIGLAWLRSLATTPRSGWWTAHVVCGALAGLVGLIWWNGGAEERELQEARAWVASDEGRAQIAQMERKAAANEAALTEAYGPAFSIASDPRAQYRAVEIRREGAAVAIITRRSGPSGVVFTERFVDCGAMRYRPGREGDTLEELRARALRDNAPAELVSGSIADVVSQYACSRAPA